MTHVPAGVTAAGEAVENNVTGTQKAPGTPVNERGIAQRVEQTKQMFIPSNVRKEADWLLELTGVEAQITHEGPGVMRITHGHERLRVETAFRACRNGWRRASSRLYQDGAQRDPVPSPEAYATLFEKLRSQGPQPTHEPPGLADLTPLPSDATLPPQVRADLSTLENSLGPQPGFNVRAGRDERNRIVVEATMTKATIQIFYETERRSGKRFATLTDFRVVTADGVNHTLRIDGELTALLRFLAGHGHALADTAVPGEDTASAGSTSREGTILRL
ncbi:hypothetical protein OG705_29530 [Streptomyces sp. NBC_00838]|uniref:hypothetical protein n=1 Tax=Streptomyces sp. NBC_00838 TaxID=2903680 RepID=UPI0038679C70|nr:hypothetical protein OG705_29530 [Streptomyces sp. NBC_00838]